MPNAMVVERWKEVRKKRPAQLHLYQVIHVGAYVSYVCVAGCVRAN